MSNSGGKVRPGEPLKIPADQYNSFIDAASKVESLDRFFAQGIRKGFNDHDTIKVRNGASANLPRFSILGLNTSTIDPASYLLEWKQQPAMNCVVPDAAVHLSRFVVIVEPLLENAMGRAVASGVVPCQVNITNEGHQYAIPETGQTAYLTSASNGSAQILWRQSGTGLKWAFVRLSNGPALLEEVSTYFGTGPFDQQLFPAVGGGGDFTMSVNCFDRLSVRTTDSVSRISDSIMKISSRGNVWRFDYSVLLMTPELPNPFAEGAATGPFAVAHQFALWAEVATSQTFGAASKMSSVGEVRKFCVYPATTISLEGFRYGFDAALLYTDFFVRLRLYGLLSNQNNYGGYILTSKFSARNVGPVNPDHYNNW